MAHTTDNIRVHRRSQDRDTDLRMKLGTFSALAIESCLTKSTASSLHRPPVSIPTTTSLQRREATSSGYLASLSLLALTSTAPSTSAVLRCGSPRACQDTAECDVHCKLCTAKARKVLQDLNASAIAGSHVHVHVAEVCVETDACACFATHPGPTLFRSEWHASSRVR